MIDGITLDMSKTYIYEGLEYILTGRVAEKKIEDPVRQRPRRSKRPMLEEEAETIIMVEIRPSPKKSLAPQFPSTDTQWVNYGNLFKVVDMLED